jgi:hypothetical protein
MSRAGVVLLALALTMWWALGGSVQVSPALYSRRGSFLDLGADSAREDVREDEAGGGMAVRHRETTGAVIHLDNSESLARDIGQLPAENQ